MTTRQENLKTIKKIFECNSPFAVRRKINESECLTDADKHLLDIVADIIESDDEVKINSLKDSQIDMFLEATDELPKVYYFKTVQDVVNYLMVIFSSYDFCMCDFTKMEDRHVCELNDTLLSYSQSVGQKLTKDYFDTHQEEYTEIITMIRDYLVSEGIYDEYFDQDIEMGMYKKEFCNESLIFEGNTVEDKIARLSTMSENELLLLYGLATGNYISNYSYSVKVALEDEIRNHPYGKVSKTLEPLSQNDYDYLQNQVGNIDPVLYDEFWRSIEDKYGKSFESYSRLYKKLLPVNESRNLMKSDRIFHLVKGVNEKLYIVGGKNNEYLRLVK